MADLMVGKSEDCSNQVVQLEVLAERLLEELKHRWVELVVVDFEVPSEDLRCYSSAVVLTLGALDRLVATHAEATK
ncbi:MAG: hypothetical protein ACRDCT_07490 [Shewanella sp.]